MGKWTKEGTVMKYYDDAGKLIKIFDTNLNKAGNGGWKDGYESNNMFQAGQAKHVEEAIQFFLENGKMITLSEFKNGTPSKQGFENNVLKDVRTWLSKNGIDEATYTNEGSKVFESTSTPKETPFNPYTNYLEQQRIGQENAERGLLNAQTDIAKQNADITAQQAMMQQSQFKDSLIEQIKADRLSKMRSGISPMQIAQENLQYTVGNMQNNQQQMQLANQGKLTAVQQEQLNPYQAYINSQAAVTGGQGYGNTATGMAASDAGDIYQQMLRMRQANPNLTLEQALAMVKQ